MKNKINNILSLPLTRYAFNSILVCFIDTTVVWVLYRLLNVPLVTANTVGVITGFVTHYLLSSKSVFQAELGAKGFCIYFGTFLFGLVLADWLIYTGENYLFREINADIGFLFSKGISVIVPFFILYYIRKILFTLINHNNTKSNEQNS